MASRTHAALDGSERTVSERTLYRWLAVYERGGLCALEPERQRVEDSAVLSETLLTFLREEKTSDALASVPELLDRARLRGKLGRLEAVLRSLDGAADVDPDPRALELRLQHYLEG